MKKITLVFCSFFFSLSIVHAAGLKLVKEYRYEVSSGYFDKMDANRHIYMGYVLGNGEPGRGLGYRMFDMKKREFTDISFPINEFQEKFPELLGTKAGPQFLAYNGETSCFWMNELEGYRTKTWYYTQYTHKSGKISRKIKMADVNDTTAIANMGIDPSNKYFYYSVNTYNKGEGADKATTSMHLYRVNLEKAEIDWDMIVTLIKRPLQLNVGYWVFNNDGTKLALLEYNDRAWEKDSHAEPQQQTYVVDIPSKKIETYPIPLSPYGRIFSPDSKYLFIGSNEEGKIIRINLEKKKVDLSGPAMRRIFDLILTPASKSLIIVADTTIISNKVVEVRAVNDMKLITSIPARVLIPGNEGASPAPVLSFDDGKYIVYPYPVKDGKKSERAFRIYAVPEDLDSPKLDDTKEEDLKFAQGIVLARQYAGAHGITIASDDRGIGDPKVTFASIVVRPNRIYFTGTTGEDEGNYVPENTRPVAVCLDTKGRLLWKKSLPKKGFREYTGASLAVDKKGNSVVFIISYYSPGTYGVSRFVKLDPEGGKIWDTQLRGLGMYNTPLADDKQLLPNGNIKIKGRIDLKMNVKHYWSGEISKDGKVISDVTGERYE